MTVEVLCLRHCQYVVQLGNQLLDGRNELDHTLRNDHSTEVVTVGSTSNYSVSDVVNDIVEAHTLLFDLLRDQTDIRLCLQSALQSDMRSRATHHLNKVPVLTGRVTVALNVTNQL